MPVARLERQAGKPRAEWSADDLVSLATEAGIRVVSLMHVGGDGWLKSLDFVPRDADHFRRIVTEGERADGSSLFAGTGIRSDASDIVLRPRPPCAFMDPFSPLPTLVLMCGHVGRDGLPLPESPDTMLQRAHARLHGALQTELWALGEVEYFLGKRSDENDVYGADDRGYHASSPFVFGEALRRRALALLADIGVPVKYGHSEVGYIEARETSGVIWEQHEIELALAPLPEAAEGVLLTQWVLRNLAHASAMRCSTDPIMLEGHAGNGLHFHFSPVREGRHLGGQTEDGGSTPLARTLIAGLVRSGAALMAFANRTPGSFTRLSQGKEAPAGIRWGDFDRSALVRLPLRASAADSSPSSPPTVEFRLPDGSALPHLLLAGVAQAMVAAGDDADVEELLRRSKAGGQRTPGSDGRLPASPSEVAAEVRNQRAVLEAGGVFPARFLDEVVARLESGAS